MGAAIAEFDALPAMDGAGADANAETDAGELVRASDVTLLRVPRLPQLPGTLPPLKWLALPPEIPQPPPTDKPLKWLVPLLKWPWFPTALEPPN